MIQWALDALREACSVDQVLVVGPSELFRAVAVCEEVTVAMNRGTFSDSLMLSLSELDGREQVLLMTADKPLLTGPALNRFIEGCLASFADLCFAISRSEELKARAPRARSTWYELGNGTCAKGNVMVARSAFLMECAERVQVLFDACNRERWMRLLGTDGLSLGEIQAALSRYLGGRVKAVSASPEVVCDVSHPADVELAQRVLGKRAVTERRREREDCPRYGGLWPFRKRHGKRQQRRREGD